MQSEKTILVAGGDLRYAAAAGVLAGTYPTHAVGFTRQQVTEERVQFAGTAADNLPLCDALILPMPVSEDGVLVNAPFSQQSLPLQAFLPLLKPGAVVCGGKFGKTEKLFRDAGFDTEDYLKREEFSIRNAVPTAEGALQILLEELPCTIQGSKVLLLGFGRIGSCLARMLHALGAEVTVAARSADKRALAELSGCRSISFAELPECADAFQVICNTVPAKVVTAEVLAAVQPETLVLDLASKPGGVDLEAAQTFGRRVVWALSLPGKVAPVTAGEIIASTILHMLEERWEKQ